MRRVCSERRGCRDRGRCPAITAPIIPTAMTAPITAARKTGLTGRACLTPAASSDIARTDDVAAAPRKPKVPGKGTDSAHAMSADLVAVLVAVTDGEPKI